MLCGRAVMPQMTKFADERKGRVRVRIGVITLSLSALVVLALAFSGAVGGQNVMSDDFWDALGLVRTEELLAADRYYDVQQFWTTVADFGFSKTREEALEVWGHDRLLEDAVRVVRMTRPLVITSVFVGGPSDGHGQHAAAGQIAQEVFAAAADRKMFR